MSTPYGLTVEMLKAVLSDMPDSFNNHIVVLSSDPEGNSFDTLGEVAVGWFRNQYEGEFRGRSPEDDETWPDAEAKATKDYTTDEDTDQDESAYLAVDEHDHPAVCLWP